MRQAIGLLVIVVAVAVSCGRPGSQGRSHDNNQAKHNTRHSDARVKKVVVVAAVDAAPTVSAAEVEGYIERLADEHPSRDRWDAEQWLIANAAVARKRLTALAATGQPDLRVAGAIRVLSRIGAAVDIPVLVGLTSRIPGTSASWDACMALSRHSAPEAGQALVKLLSHANPDVVGPVLIAIGARKDQKMRSLVEAKVVDRNSTVRFKALHALNYLGVEPSRQLLKRRLRIERDAENRSLIRRILKKKRKKKGKAKPRSNTRTRPRNRPRIKPRKEPW